MTGAFFESWEANMKTTHGQFFIKKQTGNRFKDYIME